MKSAPTVTGFEAKFKACYYFTSSGMIGNGERLETNEQEGKRDGKAKKAGTGQS